MTTPRGPGFVPLEPHELADRFPHLEILDLVGHGGMGAVYRARQTNLDRLVALKIIRPESAADPAFAERFNREAKTLARLNHPQIVGIYDFGEVTATTGGSDIESRLYYFLMEYVDGVNLRDLIQSESLTPEQALAVVPQICDALQFAHDHGIVHRDVKPENILLDRQGNVKIADFGLAKLMAAAPADLTLTATHQVMGTPKYMAPEQMQGSHAVDHRADIYSLGVVFYEMLTGEVPLGVFEPPSKKVAIDVRLDEVVLKSLAREPERRYQSVSEIKSQMERIGANSSEMANAQPAYDSGPAAGFSTIVVREAHNVWRWIWAKSTHESISPCTSRNRRAATVILGTALVLAVAIWAIRHAAWNRPDSHGRSPLLNATAEDNTDLVMELLARGADPNERHLGYEQPLWWAAFRGNTAIAQALLASGANVDARGKHHITALMTGTARGHTDVVRILLEAGADVDVKDTWSRNPAYHILEDGDGYRWPQGGQTALTLAAYGGHVDAARLLLEAGADPGIVDASGKNAMQIAQERDDTSMEALFWNYASEDLGPGGNERGEKQDADRDDAENRDDP